MNGLIWLGAMGLGVLLGIDVALRRTRKDEERDRSMRRVLDRVDTIERLLRGQEQGTKVVVSFEADTSKAEEGLDRVRSKMEELRSSIDLSTFDRTIEVEAEAIIRKMDDGTPVYAPVLVRWRVEGSGEWTENTLLAGDLLRLTHSKIPDFIERQEVSDR